MPFSRHPLFRAEAWAYFNLDCSKSQCPSAGTPYFGEDNQLFIFQPHVPVSQCPSAGTLISGVVETYINATAAEASQCPTAGTPYSGSYWEPRAGTEGR